MAVDGVFRLSRSELSRSELKSGLSPCTGRALSGLSALGRLRCRSWSLIRIRHAESAQDGDLGRFHALGFGVVHMIEAQEDARPWTIRWADVGVKRLSLFIAPRAPRRRRRARYRPRAAARLGTSWFCRRRKGQHIGRHSPCRAIRALSLRPPSSPVKSTLTSTFLSALHDRRPRAMARSVQLLRDPHAQPMPRRRHRSRRHFRRRARALRQFA